MDTNLSELIGEYKKEQAYNQAEELCQSDDPHLQALMDRPGSVAEATEDGFTRSFR